MPQEAAFEGGKFCGIERPPGTVSCSPRLRWRLSRQRRTVFFTVRVRACLLGHVLPLHGIHIGREKKACL